MPTVSAPPAAMEASYKNLGKTISWTILCFVVVFVFVVAIYAAMRYIRNKYEDPKQMR